jgi:hypothetical protein
MAHLAAGALVPDGAGLKLLGTFERGFYFFLSSHLEKGLRGRISGFQIFSHDFSKTPFLEEMRHLLFTSL